MYYASVLERGREKGREERRERERQRERDREGVRERASQYKAIENSSTILMTHSALLGKHNYSNNIPCFANHVKSSIKF